MKKIKSIGKKVMSVGLAASLLLAPVSANKCFAAPKDAQQIMEEQKKANKVYRDSKESNLILIALILIFAAYCGYNNPETVKKAAEVISGSVKGTCNFIGDKKEAITKFWTAHGDSIVKELGFVKAFGVRTATDIGTFIKALLVLAKHLGEDVFELGDCVYRILERIGFKNVLSAVGGLYVTNKLCNVTKGVYNKVSGLFKSKKNEQEKDNKEKTTNTVKIDVNVKENENVKVKENVSVNVKWLNENGDKLKKALGL